MADLVGRTISATSDRPPPGRGGRRHARPHSGSRGNRAPRAPGPAGGGGASPSGGDVTRPYALVEAAMVNLPTPGNNGELRPTEAARTKEILNQTWDGVREWLAAHPSEADRRGAATHQGQFLTTVLHMACKLADPPLDVIQSLIECAEETASWPDANGWLPLHHACANGASGKVLSVLVQAYPEGKVQQDKRFRTPLHFAFFRKDAVENQTSLAMKDDGDGVDDDVGNSMAEIVQLLADSGAAELQDEGGMVPMHYAAVYGTTREVLEVLLESYPEGTTKKENKGRNALHLTMVNAHRQSSPKVVGFLLETDAAEIIDGYDDDHHLPIHLLAMASKFPEEKVLERKNAAECLKLYLNAKPKASPDFLSAVQTLPEWLRDIAVISDHIQDILNHKIVMRFPTMILILDAFFIALDIFCFELASLETIDHLFTKDHEDPTVTVAPVANKGYIFMTMIGGGYFLLREVVQIISLLNLGNVGSWLTDGQNWLDALLIFFIFYFGVIMLESQPLISKEAFRTGAAVTKGIMWTSVVGYLKSINIEFSVFVSGVIFVVQSLAAFLLAMGVILLLFAQMFYIMYTETDECKCTAEWAPEGANPFPHCIFKDSALKIYTMLMGEIGNEMRYSSDGVAQFMYFMFAIFVVILLSNVLIAIVTDSYAVIKNERAAMVFWSNRLDYVAEMDAVKNVGKSIMRCCGIKKDEPSRAQGKPHDYLKDGRQSVGLFRKQWEWLMDLFKGRLNDDEAFEYFCGVLARFVAVVFVIPVWLIVGLCTAGWLWPPQVRELLLKQKKVGVTRADLALQVTEQIKDLKNEIKMLRVDMKGEMKSDRKEFLKVKAEVEGVQKEVMADLLQVKEIMVTLLEMSRDHLDTPK